MILYPISSNFCKQRFSTMIHLSRVSFIEDFAFIPFQQKKEIKKGKYPNGAQTFLLDYRCV